MLLCLSKGGISWGGAVAQTHRSFQGKPMKQAALLCDDSKAAMKGIGDSTTRIRGKYVWDMGVWRPRITLPAREEGMGLPAKTSWEKIRN